ncbi:MAG: thiolase family protein [Candidatus Neomarinimicrobiota bacterium]
MSGDFTCKYEDIYLLGGARTPFGKFQGTLGLISPTDLGIIAGRAALKKAGVSAADINHVVFANIIQSSFDAIYLARHIQLYCRIPITVPALMVQRLCGSGFESIISAAEQIILGKAGLVLAGGTENMTLAPTAAFGNRLGYGLGRLKFGDMLWEGLFDPAGNCSMGQTAENLADKYKITREHVDEYALRSHALAFKSREMGLFAEEIEPVKTSVLEVDGLSPRRFRTSPKNNSLENDENIRETKSAQLMALKPTFAENGVQTAGNSSGIVDGAAAVVVGSKASALSGNLKPLAKILASASTGVEPELMGIGPAPAIRKLLQTAGLKIDDIDLFEINEAFGAQIVAVERELALDRNKLNVKGGAIALGHPLAATGTRLTHTLALELKKRGLKYGVCSACIGGGQGTALLIENPHV